MNLLTRMGWEARILEHDGRNQRRRRSTDVATEVVDYMLFVDEAPLDGITGTSGFAERFGALGPRDSKGRSLRDLDLQRRLFRYPCSYMIYSEAFERASRSGPHRRLRTFAARADRQRHVLEVSEADLARSSGDSRNPPRDEEGPSPLPHRPLTAEARRDAGALDSTHRVVRHRRAHLPERRARRSCPRRC